MASGTNLDVYRFKEASCYSDAPTIRFEGAYSVGEPRAHHDITAIAFFPDNDEDRTLLVGHADGSLKLVTLPGANDRSDSESFPKTLLVEEDPIESVSISSNLSFSLSGSGKGTLREVASGTASAIDIHERSWSSFISTARTSYVAIGTSSALPLAIYPIHDSILDSRPSVALTGIISSEVTGRLAASAVYGITGPPPSFPGRPGDIVVSGWFDGRVRIYDLRMPSFSSSTTKSPMTPLLTPIMTLSDPWNTESVYAVSSGGGSGHSVAAGTSRHSVVALWDLRAPREGWSVHAPGNDQSPVYSVVLESSRLFGATQSRPFILDFGPDVGVETYPDLPRLQKAPPRNRRRIDDSLWTEDGLRYAVTKYLHRNPMARG